MKRVGALLLGLSGLVLLTGHLPLTAHGQGCVAIRHFSPVSGAGPGAAFMNRGDVAVGASYRYFKSFRHFRGRHEEPDRIANNTEVVNYAHALDLNVLYALSRRTYATLTLPFVTNARSSLYEHGRTERHNSFSRGLADARVGVGRWLLDPSRHHHANVALGLGLKLPTGSYHATDLFYNVGVDGHPEVRPVDQSIQPGDGGFGFTVDFQVFQQIADRFSWYGNGFYLFNPRETNGVRTFRETLSAQLSNEAIMSVPDQFAVRLGATYALPAEGASVSLGVRYEGVPVEDLLGGSQGFRRPGTVFSVEPGLSYALRNVSLNVSVPVALSRNRPQSVTDLEMEHLTGTPRHGDAAFADYLINVGLTYRIARRAPARTPALFDTEHRIEPGPDGD